MCGCSADDLAMLVAGQNKENIIARTNRVVTMVVEKLSQLGTLNRSAIEDDVFVNSGHTGGGGI